MKTTFATTLLQAGGKNATGIQVPAEAVAALGTQKRPKVIVHLNGYTYRSTIAAYGDVFMLPVSAEHREAAGLKAGDPMEMAGLKLVESKAFRSGVVLLRYQPDRNGR